MNLIRIDQFYPNYREELFDGDDIKGLPVYAGRSQEKIGSIDNVLVDEEGQFRYFVIDTGFWIFGKKVLLPVGQCQVDEAEGRIYALGLRNKQQAEDLPEYHDDMNVDYAYEERVRGVYRTPTVDQSAPLESPVPVDPIYQSGAARPVEPPTPVTPAPARPVADRSAYNYQQEPDLYGMDDQNHKRIRLYEERLVANKHRRKVGDVTVGKHVETETVRASVPVSRERVVVERSTPTNPQPVGDLRETDFREGEVARMEVYEETPDIRKEAVVREEVRVHKEVEQEMIETKETVRREELDIDKQGREIIDRT